MGIPWSRLLLLSPLPVERIVHTAIESSDDKMTFGRKFPYQNMQIHLTDNISETNRVDRGFKRFPQPFYMCGLPSLFFYFGFLMLISYTKYVHLHGISTL